MESSGSRRTCGAVRPSIVFQGAQAKEGRWREGRKEGKSQRGSASLCERKRTKVVIAKGSEGVSVNGARAEGKGGEREGEPAVVRH